MGKTFEGSTIQRPFESTIGKTGAAVGRVPCSLPSTRAPNSVASGLNDTRVRLPPHRPAAAGTKGLEAASRLMVGGLTLSSLAISACVSPAAMRCNASSR